MKKVNVQGMEIGMIGMRCMGFSHAHGDPAPREECIAMMRKAHEMGVTLYDTADVYANGHNEILVGEALAPIRNEVQILTKFNPEVAPVSDLSKGTVEQQIEERCDASLKRLNTDYIDIYMMHRVPDDLPIETYALAMKKLIEKGKIKAWALSRAREDQIRKAHAICPLAIVQNEFSMVVRNVETDGTLQACKELGIAMTPYMPLASGLLTGAYKPGMKLDFKNDDIHRTFSWFTEENLEKNQPLFDMLEKFSKKKGCTYAQLALAWVMHKYDKMIPIPGMYKPEFIDSNLETCNIVLSDEDMAEIDAILDSLTIYGDGQEWRVDQLRNMLKEEGYEVEKSWHKGGE